MIYPNKHIRFEDSIIFKMVHILENNKVLEIDIHELLLKTKRKILNVDEFIYSLDILYVLDMIDVDFENEMVRYVKRD